MSSNRFYVIQSMKRSHRNHCWPWSGELLSSGRNDNVVNVWDGRALIEEGRKKPVLIWIKGDHTAAVNVLIFHSQSFIELVERLFIFFNSYRHLRSYIRFPLCSHPEVARMCTINVWVTTTTAGASLHSHHTPNKK